MLKTYQREVLLRNKVEVEPTTLAFIRDYLHLQRELKTTSGSGGCKTLSQSQSQQDKTSSELRVAHQEIDRLKAQLGTKQLSAVTSQLDVAEQQAQQSDKLREIQRRNLALEKRLAEVEHLLKCRDQDRQDFETTLAMAKSDLARMTSLHDKEQEKCKQLAQDNADYVRQLLEMREKMGHTLNQLLSGTPDSSQSRIKAAA